MALSLEELRKKSTLPNPRLTAPATLLRLPAHDSESLGNSPEFLNRPLIKQIISQTTGKPMRPAEPEPEMKSAESNVESEHSEMQYNEYGILTLVSTQESKESTEDNTSFERRAKKYDGMDANIPPFSDGSKVVMVWDDDANKGRGALVYMRKWKDGSLSPLEEDL